MTFIRDFVDFIRSYPAAKPRSEVTSPAVARKAATILGRLSRTGDTYATIIMADAHRAKYICTVEELKAVCGSALTQAKDKKDKK